MVGAPTSTDLFADPQNALQMTAVFTEHYVCEQAWEEGTVMGSRCSAYHKHRESQEQHHHLCMAKGMIFPSFAVVFMLILTYFDRTMMRPPCLKFKVGSSGHIFVSMLHSPTYSVRNFWTLGVIFFGVFITVRGVIPGSIKFVILPRFPRIYLNFEQG